MIFDTVDRVRNEEINYRFDLALDGKIKAYTGFSALDNGKYSGGVLSRIIYFAVEFRRWGSKTNIENIMRVLGRNRSLGYHYLKLLTEPGIEDEIRAFADKYGYVIYNHSKQN